MATAATVEERLTAVEQAVEMIQWALATTPVSGNWLEQVKGSITDDEAFQKALEYGRAWRQIDIAPRVTA